METVVPVHPATRTDQNELNPCMNRVRLDSVVFADVSLLKVKEPCTLPHITTLLISFILPILRLFISSEFLLVCFSLSSFLLPLSFSPAASWLRTAPIGQSVRGSERGIGGC
ncbi:hypothetical protein J5N97_009007 [Dioscorea zingiberensis]|uniref:Uncharacterized protein n=1 Tax=Dioscorea zingiberensis TaxID=325984 RepID=A0A9D5CXF0_9LILI|nr:hypothetical protein J5N97_009007 [Dioscorea zingiberensis]